MDRFRDVLFYCSIYIFFITHFKVHWCCIKVIFCLFYVLQNCFILVGNKINILYQFSICVYLLYFESQNCVLEQVFSMFLQFIGRKSIFSFYTHVRYYFRTVFRIRIIWPDPDHGSGSLQETWIRIRVAKRNCDINIKKHKKT